MVETEQSPKTDQRDENGKRYYRRPSAVAPENPPEKAPEQPSTMRIYRRDRSDQQKDRALPPSDHFAPASIEEKVRQLQAASSRTEARQLVRSLAGSDFRDPRIRDELSRANDLVTSELLALYRDEKDPTYLVGALQCLSKSTILGSSVRLDLARTILTLPKADLEKQLTLFSEQTVLEVSTLARASARGEELLTILLSTDNLDAMIRQKGRIGRTVDLFPQETINQVLLNGTRGKRGFVLVFLSGPTVHGLAEAAIAEKRPLDFLSSLIDWGNFGIMMQDDDFRNKTLALFTIEDQIKAFAKFLRIYISRGETSVRAYMAKLCGDGSALAQYYENTGVAPDSSVSAAQYANALRACKEFGFETPLRFTPATLVELVRTRRALKADPDALASEKVLFVVGAKSDSEFALTQMAEQLEQFRKNNYRIVYVESGSEADLYAQLESKPLSELDADVLMLMGHGQPTSLALGWSLDEDSDLDINDADFRLQFARRLKSGGSVISMSCSTGSVTVSENFAQYLRKAFPQARENGIFAPTHPSTGFNVIFDSEGNFTEAQMRFNKDVPGGTFRASTEGHFLPRAA